MASLSRKTYDTDVITLRRIFAYNPDTNAPISPGTILAVTGSRGTASFIDPLQLSSIRYLSTVVGAGAFESMSTGNLGVSSISFVDIANGARQQMVVSSGVLYLNNATIMGSGNLTTGNLVSTVAGLGTAGYVSTFSTNQLSTGLLKSGGINTSTLSLIDAANGSLRTITSSNNFLYYNGSIVNFANINYNTSTYVYQVSSVSTIYAYNIPVSISTATNLFINTNYYSSVSFSTGQLTTSSVNFMDTATNATQLLAVTNGQLLLNNAAIVADLTKQQMFSTVAGLGTIGYVSSSGLASTTDGLLTNLFPPYFASTVAGLGVAGYTSNTQLTSTTGGLLTNLLPPFFTSTVVGLGSAGYISSTGLTSTTGGLLDNLLPPLFTSTVVGLGSAGYISSTGLTSTTGGLVTNLLPPFFASTVRGLGSAGYISSSQLGSTTAGILTNGVPPIVNNSLSAFVSTPSLISSLSNLYVPYSGNPAGSFQLFAQSNTMNFGLSGQGTSQIFVGDARRASAPANTDPLIKISQDVGTNPRGADVLNILGGVGNASMIKVDSNLNLGLGLSQSVYANATGLSYPLYVNGIAFLSSCVVQDRIVASNYMMTSTFILTDSFAQFSSFGPATSNIRLALASGDAYKPTGATWKTLSDSRIKEDIVEADYGRCYNDVKQIPLRRYRYTSSFIEQAGVVDRTVLGFVAQELAPIMPKSVTSQALYGIDDLNTISVDQINMAMVGALKKTILDKEVLEGTVSGLVSSNAQLTGQVTELQQRITSLQQDYLARVSTIEGNMESMKNDLSMSHSIL